jgi:hypothetical protein
MQIVDGRHDCLFLLQITSTYARRPARDNASPFSDTQPCGEHIQSKRRPCNHRLICFSVVSQLGTGKMPVAPKECLHNRKFAGSSIPTQYSIFKKHWQDASGTRRLWAVLRLEIVHPTQNSHFLPPLLQPDVFSRS